VDRSIDGREVEERAMSATPMGNLSPETTKPKRNRRGPDERRSAADRYQRTRLSALGAGVEAPLLPHWAEALAGCGVVDQRGNRPGLRAQHGRGEGAAFCRFLSVCQQANAINYRIIPVTFTVYSTTALQPRSRTLCARVAVKSDGGISEGPVHRGRS
jgi:hypothetical protein